MKIKFHSAGFKQVLNSPGVMGMVESEARKMVARADTVGAPSPTKRYGYKTGRTDRARAIVFPDTPHAAASNRKHNTLLKAMGG